MKFKNRPAKPAAPFFFLLLIILTVLPVDICSAYIMPSEQVIEFMTRNFSGLRTIAITQHTEQADTLLYHEQVFMELPDLIYRKVPDRNMDMISSSDTAYYALLMGNKPSMIKNMLSAMRIDLDTTGYTRIDGTVAYCIGGREPTGPGLLVEKERFLPLLLKYRSADDPYGEIITVEFKDYRQLDKGWFPFEIVYSLGNSIIESYLIQSVQTNVSIDPSLFQSDRKLPDPDIQAPKESSSETEKDHPRQIIDSLEEKYN